MNRRQILAIFAGVMSLATGILAVRVFWLPPVEEVPEHPLSTRSDYRLSGPFTHKNLTIYLIHGSSSMTGRSPITLEEAMERKTVIVHETGDVNELAIENLSATDEVYVQAGDIVKGGRQDRVLSVDLIVPARSGRMPIDSFCVENGRWTQRGLESKSEFDSSSEYVASKDLKVAAKHSKSQSEVWEKVEESQVKLSAATNSNVASNVSRSSLPLTLENKVVREDASEYIRALSGILGSKADAIGFVFAINGKINSADTYGSNSLFLKLWPKLLKATAIEAVGETYREMDGKQPGVSVVEIDEFFVMAENAAVVDDRSITDRVRMITRENKESLFLESLDRGMMLHRNYILK